ARTGRSARRATSGWPSGVRAGRGKPGFPRELSVAEAADDVVVDHADRLHERIADRRADEAEAAALEVAAHRLRVVRFRGDLGERLPPVHARRAADERPQVRVEAPELDRGARVADRRLDLR